MSTGKRYRAGRLVSILLVFCMILSLMPMAALADEPEEEPSISAGTEDSDQDIALEDTPQESVDEDILLEETPQESDEEDILLEETPQESDEEDITSEPETTPVDTLEVMPVEMPIMPMSLGDPISDYFTVSVSTNTSFQTYDIPSGTPVQLLPVTLTITTKLNTSISGGKILLPLAPEAPNGMVYFHYDSSDSVTGNTLIDSVTEVDTDGDGINDALEITLKDTVPANTQVTFMLYYEMGSQYVGKVMEGTVMWDPVTATLQMDDAADETATAGSVKTSATDDRYVSRTLQSPTTSNSDGTVTVTPGSVTSFRVQFYDTNYYKIDFADGTTPVARVYFPAGTTNITVPSGANGKVWTLATLDPGDNRICYELVLPDDPALWSRHNYGGTIGFDYELFDWSWRFPDSAEDKALPVTIEFIYQLAGDTDETGTQKTTMKTLTIDYVMGTEVEWDFYYYAGGYHGNDNASYLNISGTADGDVANGTTYANGVSSYTRNYTTKNQGTVDVTGVSQTLTQPAGDAVINFSTLAIFAARESTSDPWSSYNYSLNIVNAQTNANRTVAGTVKSTSTTATTATLSILSGVTLGTGEYIESVTVTPVNSNGDVGHLMSKNGFGIRYQHKAWNGQVWPSGVSVPSVGTAIAMTAAVYWNDESGDPQSVSKNYTIYYAENPVLAAAQFVPVDTDAQNKNPGDTLTYQLNLYNFSYAARYAWENPVIAFKAPKYLRLTGVSEGSYTEYYDAANDDYYYILRLDSDIAVSASTATTVNLSFKIADNAAQGTYTFDRVWVASSTYGVYVYSISAMSGNSSYGYNYVPSGVYADFAAALSGLSHNFIYQRTSNLAGRGYNHTGYTINKYVSLSGVSEVKTNSTGGWIAEAVVPTTQGEDANVRLTLTNSGNVAVSSIRLYDIIPYDGYLGSDGEALFTGLSDTTGWTVYYYTGSTPPALSDVSTISYTGSGWSSTAPADMSTVKAVLLVYSGSLAAGASLSATLNFNVDEDDVTVYNKYSFSYTADGSTTTMTSGLHGFSTQVYMLSYNANTTDTSVEGIPSTITGDFNAAKNASGEVILTISSTVPTRNGYTFASWNTQVDGNGIAYAAGGTVTLMVGHTSVTLYAVWTPLAEYTVTYNANGGDGTAPASQTAAWSNDYKVYISGAGGLSKTDFTFKEWNTNASANSTDTVGTVYTVGAQYTIGANLDLYAIWGATLTYNANNGSGAPTDSTVYYAGDTATVSSAVPTRTNYSFLGWSTNANATTAAECITGSITLAQNTTLYAVWKANQYTVTFYDENGTTQLGTSTVDYGSAAVRPSSPTKAATAQYTYTFADWVAMSTYTGDLDNVKENMSYKASYTATTNQHTVTFYDENGTTQLGTSTVDYGSAAVRPSSPAKAATAQYTYTFAGWVAMSTYTGDLNNVKESMSYKASYTATTNQYTVTFYDEDGTTVLGTSTVNYGTAAARPNSPTKTATAQYTYTFAGWVAMDTYTGDLDSVKENMSYKASYTETTNQYTVTFYDENETTVLGTSTVDYGTAAVKPSDPAKTATAQYTYTFDTWVPMDTYTGSLTSVTENMSYKASYTATTNQYTVTFYDEDGTTQLGTSIIDYSSAAIKPADPTKTATAQYTFTFANWGAMGTYTGDLDNVKENMSYKASYTETTNQYTVTFYDEDGMTQLGTSSVDYGSAATKPTDPTKTATAQYTYTFANWVAMDTYTGDLDNVKENMSYKASYTETTNTYTVTFESNGGSAVASQTVSYGGTVTEPANPTRSGYTFQGWYKESSLTNAWSFSTDTVTEDITLYARWTSNGGGGGGGGSTTYTVTYNANGGSGSYKVTGLSSGDEHKVLSLSTTGITHTDYTFTGWNTKSDGTGTDYASGDTITVTGNVTLYAQWEAQVGNVNTASVELETENHIVYILGYPNGSVGADRAITRAEAASIFYRLLKEQGTAANRRFSDVNNGAWYAKAVNYLASVGILTGYPDGTFKPDAPITRAEFAAIASRFDNLSTSGNVFRDVSDSHWAVGYINSAYAKGWINGYPDGTFRPDNQITRAEVVKIVNAMLNRAIDSDALAKVKNPYNDITASHWAYAEIIEASLPHEYDWDNDGKECWLSW